jgi:hypothetical protein
MTNEDMIQLAREAGWEYANGDDGYSPLWKFGELVAAAEREACAKVCEAGIHNAVDWNSSYWDQALEQAASVIRARGQHDKLD